MPVLNKECPAAAGDLVLVQINLQTSVEGYTLRDDNSSYWPDPSLSEAAWRIPFRPAVILSTTEKEEGRFSFLLVPLANGTPGDALSLREIGLDGLPNSLSNLSAYVFPRAMEVHCFPSQVHLHTLKFNASQLIYGLYRHRCAHSGSCRPPLFSYYGRNLMGVYPCSIIAR